MEALATVSIAPGDGEGWITVGEQAIPVKARKPRSDALDPALRDEMHAQAALRGLATCRTLRGWFHMSRLRERARRARPLSY